VQANTVNESAIFSARPVAPGHLLYLERSRLDELIGKALDYPVLAVIGGAGYGKTLAVYSCLQKLGMRTVWMQFTERDNIGERFWENYTQSISMINGKTAAKLAKQGFPATEQQFERYLSIPLADLNPKVKLVFVYDDFHLIQDKTVLRFLEHSITTPFPSVTSILISRTNLSINLISLYSKGLLTAINEDDLRFSRDEIEAFFIRQNITVEREDIDSVCHDTEGWAFAVHIAGLHFIKRPAGEDYGTQLRRNIFQLVESELMSRIKEDLRKFLLKLALMEESPPELIRELARLHYSPEGFPESEKSEKSETLIRQVGEIGSFIRFDEYHNVFRIHRLFRDYLRGLQHELNEEERQEVYRAAACWCARNKLTIDAILYYEKAKKYEEVIAQINRLPQGVSGSTTMELLLKIMRNLPWDVYAQHGEAIILFVRFLLSDARTSEAREVLEKFIKTFEALPEDDSRNRGLFACYIGMGFLTKFMSITTNDFSFPEYFAKALYHKTQWGGELEKPFTLTGLGCYACRVGSGDPALMEGFLEALAVSTPDVAASMRGNMYGVVELARGELAFFRGAPKEAEGFLREALTKTRELRQYDLETRALFYLMRTGFFYADAGMIQESAGAIAGFLDNEEYFNRHVHNDIYRGWLYAQLGECEKIPVWLKKEDRTAPNSLVRGMELLVKTRICFREKNYEAALSLIGQTETNARLFLLGKIETKVLEAVCLYQMRQKARAYAVLEEARLLAEPNGFFTPFAELGKDMRSLVCQALKDKASLPVHFLETIRNLSSLYAKKFSQVAEQLSDHSRPLQRLGSLSRKECEVLSALFQGLTQDEIAASSSRSANTIKSLIRRVYEKLGAANKADAIRIALSRGLLEWEGIHNMAINVPQVLPAEKKDEDAQAGRPLLWKKPASDD
jgi:LuxR family maltose regulon positive regulatory protein